MEQYFDLPIGYYGASDPERSRIMCCEHGLRLLSKFYHNRKFPLECPSISCGLFSKFELRFGESVSQALLRISLRKLPIALATAGPSLVGLRA